jgi:hypothetical protein
MATLETGQLHMAWAPFQEVPRIQKDARLQLIRRPKGASYILLEFNTRRRPSTSSPSGGDRLPGGLTVGPRPRERPLPDDQLNAPSREKGVDERARIAGSAGGPPGRCRGGLPLAGYRGPVSRIDAEAGRHRRFEAGLASVELGLYLGA